VPRAASAVPPSPFTRPVARPSYFRGSAELDDARSARAVQELDGYLSLLHVVVAPTGTSGSFVDTELERRGLARRVALRVSSFLVPRLNDDPAHSWLRGFVSRASSRL